MERDRGGRPRYPGIITPAEQRVLEELRNGGTNAEIAVRLGIGPETVKTHISSMLEKLDLESRQELARWRPREERRRLLGFLALPGTLASVGRPLIWAGAGLATAAASALLLVALLALFRGDPESTGVAGEAGAVDPADVRYVNAVCLAGTRLQDRHLDAAARWGVHPETWGEDVRSIPALDLGTFAAEVWVEPYKNYAADLQRLSAPPGVEDFHAASLRHSAERAETLDEILDLFPSEGESGGTNAPWAYSRLMGEVGVTQVGVPGASVALRGRLFRAAAQAPECADTSPLVAFLGGGDPAPGASPDDERYLQQLCSAGRVFEESLLEMATVLSGRADSEAQLEGFSDSLSTAGHPAAALVELVLLATDPGGQVPSQEDLELVVGPLVQLRIALQSASPPDDLATFHLKYLELLDDSIAHWRSLPRELRRIGGAEHTQRLLRESLRTMRIYGDEGEPTPPPDARIRLLESAQSVEACSGVGFVLSFLGPEGSSASTRDPLFELFVEETRSDCEADPDLSPAFCECVAAWFRDNVTPERFREFAAILDAGESLPEVEQATTSCRLAVGWTEELQESFLEDCRTWAYAAGFCQCMLDWLVENVTMEDLLELTASDGGDRQVPAEFAAEFGEAEARCSAPSD
ncbi:MAG: helix-turn-helix transcriptional regulator [bacterium]|nr:helix-turn-helix transcriptional regulator [bacterium]